MHHALIEEVTKYDVHCPDCGGPSAQFDSRSMAEKCADEHDALWHAPVFDEEGIPA